MDTGRGQYCHVTIAVELHGFTPEIKVRWKQTSGRMHIYIGRAVSVMPNRDYKRIFTISFFSNDLLFYQKKISVRIYLCIHWFKYVLETHNVQTDPIQCRIVLIYYFNSALISNSCIYS